MAGVWLGPHHGILDAAVGTLIGALAEVSLIGVGRARYHGAPISWGPHTSSQAEGSGEYDFAPFLLRMGRAALGPRAPLRASKA